MQLIMVFEITKTTNDAISALSRMRMILKRLLQICDIGLSHVMQLIIGLTYLTLPTMRYQLKPNENGFGTTATIM